jgi:sigma-E factor negative regulatory protein RseC
LLLAQQLLLRGWVVFNLKRALEITFSTKEKKMAQKRGWVARTGEDGWATVVIQRGDACHDCEASRFCDSLTNCANLETRVLNKAGAGVGDLVTIHLSSHTVLKGALVLYLIPVLGLLTGAVAGSGFSKQLAIGQTGAALLFGLAGIALGFILTATISKRMSAGNRLTPEITNIVKAHEGQKMHINRR